MREIRYRIWMSNETNPNGKMYYPGDNVELRHRESAVPLLSPHGDLYLGPSAIDLEGKNPLCRARWANSSIEIMLSTGLCDKAGKEIWEGDIVRNDDCFGCVSGWGDATDNFPDMRVVVWDAEEAKFAWDFIEEAIKGRACAGYTLCKGNEGLLEKIGDIYQNPELLEGATS